jgi:hypothetical protein
MASPRVGTSLAVVLAARLSEARCGSSVGGLDKRSPRPPVWTMLLYCKLSKKAVNISMQGRRKSAIGLTSFMC